MQSLSVDGRVLHVRVEGPSDSETVVAFSNSLGTDFRIWNRLVALLPRGWKVVRYDTAGHGLSDEGPDMGIEDHARDLLAVLDFAGAEKAYVVGLSVGGMIAQALAADHPERVAAVCLSNTAPKIGTQDLWQTRIDGIRNNGLESLADGIMERWFSLDFRSRGSEEVKIWRNMLVRTPAGGYADTCAAIRDADLTAKARTIHAPALCLGGSEDGATPPDLVQACAATIPNGRYVEIEGVGHLPCVEAPEKVAEAIVPFFKEFGA
ncbi:3-oxoadipate enol-lactonase [Stappia sp. GBMRC 2046]|uniref:3-oxoadipate enol-lactonase n=1 Tax=Stappia sediminis TaxID=2692190 RepID=A0A7X3LT84_9HYPH|nr:3-oxoadipate enol-lactonase [Stappia sediminis]MXN64672.1 3-oxoadipate enol-lactonase [Stappia sediminis]